MKIAFVSYEYPPEFIGGIATYLYSAVDMLTSRGHFVEVFTASKKENITIKKEFLTIHKIKVSSRAEFPIMIKDLFIIRHECVKFDVLEGPDYNADTIEIKNSLPSLPLVVKLHTPSFLVNKYNSYNISISSHIRFFLGALIRGRLSLLSVPKYDRKNDPEYNHILKADEIAAPSLSIREKIISEWNIDKNKVSCFPYPYIPSNELLEIPLDSDTRIVTFIGRLEIRKGILDLVKAIPFILKEYPETKFRFIGSSSISPKNNKSMCDFIKEKLRRNIKSLEFMKQVPLDKIPFHLSNTDICVFPSIWESFGLVCLEAMSAGRSIVASNNSGMAELLDYGKCGLLVPPNSPMSIVQSVNKLLESPILRMELGANSRKRVLSKYNSDVIGSLQEASYIRAINNNKLTN